ncbi:MAG: DUF1385 domain-containing protein [Oscillochloris sp.]|nr:DUF1385 domain-containing protein [Oscillochloris sp.]
MDEQRFAYGGQAVLEGVMMRGRRQATVVVYRPSGELAVKHILTPTAERPAWMGLPVIRGLFGLGDAFSVGKQALDFSANVLTGEDEPELSPLAQGGIFGGAILIGVGIFVVLPSLIANMASRMGAPLLLREVIEGMLNLSLVVGYIYAISRLRDIQRLFGYHGAEHKTINAYEAGAPLTVESVRSFTRIHPRCGTSFLVVTALIGFLIFLSVSGLPLWQRIGARIILIPLVAAVALEFLRLAAAHYHRPWVRRLMAPTLATQYLTTREPDDTMIAAAIAALTPVLAADGVGGLSTAVPEPEFVLSA